MKKHLTWLLIVTGLMILVVIFVICMIFWNIFQGLFLQSDINLFVEQQYFDHGTVHSPLAAYIFLALKQIINFYFLMLLISAFRFQKKMRSGEFIFQDQGGKIKFVGSGLIAYASIKYALSVFFGYLFFDDLGTIVRGMSGLLLFCVIGKLLLLTATVSFKAEDYKTENDLTV